MNEYIISSSLMTATAATCSAIVQKHWVDQIDPDFKQNPLLSPEGIRSDTNVKYLACRSPPLPNFPLLSHWTPKGAEQPGGSCQPSQAAERRVRGHRLIPETEHCLGDCKARWRDRGRSRTQSFIHDGREKECEEKEGRWEEWNGFEDRGKESRTTRRSKERGRDNEQKKERRRQWIRKQAKIYCTVCGKWSVDISGDLQSFERRSSYITMRGEKGMSSPYIIDKQSMNTKDWSFKQCLSSSSRSSMQPP